MRLPFFNKSEPQEPVAFEDSLIEDPERQKARHRLIGAAFLVAVGFIGLPLIFDSKPKQHNNDVAIQIIQPGIKSEEDKSVKEEAMTTGDVRGLGFVSGNPLVGDGFVLNLPSSQTFLPH